MASWREAAKAEIPCTMSMRDEILRVATELYTLRGYRGVSFSDIAEVLGITTTSIHYHFKNKVGLAKEALDEYAVGVEREIRAIWMASDTTLARKMQASLDFNRRSYYRFNRPGEEGRVWSLLSRFANELDALPPEFRDRIGAFRAEVHACTRRGLEIAAARGEVQARILRTDMSRMLAQSFLYAGYIARDSGSFDGVERNYRLVMDLLHRAYGSADASS
jgi:AcrR family transcriptional regulator